VTVLPPSGWRECFVGLEAARLARSPVWRGVEVPDGGGRPVLLIPGFLAGDGSLAVLTRWLRTVGYRTRRAGISINAACSERACATLEVLLEELAAQHGRRVAIVGHSRGGVLAKGIAAARPDLVSGIVTLAAPTVARLPASPLMLGQMATAAALDAGHFPGVASWRCLTGSCGRRFRRALTGPFPGDVGFVSVYARSDPFADWRACQDPAAELAEIDSSHVGMVFNAHAYERIASALASFGGAGALPGGASAVGRPGDRRDARAA
jgi:pimeloyl-ACP methyl ester carboxylesterase